MMCWENLGESPEKEPCKETYDEEEKPDEEMQKVKR